MKSVEKLLKPRYKVVATYPFNDHFMLNEVIELNEFDGREHLAKHMNEWFVMQRPLNPQSDRLPLTMHESTFNLYPHLFKRLEWFEDREPGDMPEYVKRVRQDKTVQVLRVLDPSCNMREFGHEDNTIEHRFVWPNASGYLPATLQEYNEYLESKKEKV
jgi:hypothetical protein